ncbi:MAG: UvrB/UvrC motif-containing protein [Clostridia bacterium]|nr:UvrB/UvrC motif-containing protein [Clostridia bacterium]
MNDFNMNLNSNNFDYNFVQNNVCEKCGMFLNDIKRTGIVGCINCYKVFENEIKQMVFNNQGTINHIGQIPSRHFSKVKIKELILDLEKQKEKAIVDEDYVSAESIKNQIEKLRGEL